MEVEKLENLRKKIKKNSIIGFIVVVIVNVIIAMALRKSNILPFKYYYVLPFTLAISAIIASMFNNKYYNEYTTIYKNTFVLSSLKDIFSDLKYNFDEGLEEEILEETDMIYLGDIYHSNDYIEGKYKGINFKSSDVHIQEEHETEDKDGNKETEYVTIFFGRWFIFDFNKPFKADLCVTQIPYMFRGYHKKYEKVKLEDEVFNKNFLVYAQNEHEAFYILTPSFMEKLKELSEKMGGHLMLCFTDSKLYIGLNNYKDAFEPNFNKKVNEEIIKNDIKKDIQIITDFIEKLDLDNDLFKEI